MFTISIRKDVDGGYTFPSKQPLTLKLEDLLENTVDVKYYLSEKAIEKMKRYAKNYTRCGICPTLTTELAHSTGKNLYPKLVKEIGYRRLTIKECFRLMGFDSEDSEKATKINSTSQLYKQVGNSIVVNVLEAILDSLFGDGK